MKIRQVIIRYIKAKTALMECMETHEKLSCNSCGYYNNCIILTTYKKAWNRLQKFYEKHKDE